MRQLAILAILLSSCCNSERISSSAAALEGCVCVCPDDAPGPDATVIPIDAPEFDAPDDAEVVVDALEVDAPPAQISCTDAWVRSVITPGATSGIYRGADGVAMDNNGCIVSPFEDGGAVVMACPVGAGWSREDVATIAGAEDSKPADLDADGVTDVVTCSDSGARCYITFRGATNVTVTLPYTIGHGRAMQAAIADLDGDGFKDIVFGTRAGAPAVVGVLKHPGAMLARNGSAWIYSEISQAGWVMSLVTADVDFDGDIDVVVSDRMKNGTSWALYGSRWSENLGGGAWVNHPISAPAGGCGTMACTPGDEMMLSVVDFDGDGDLDVIDGTSHKDAVNSRIVLHTNLGGFTSWSHTAFPVAANVGHYQHAIAADVNLDGQLDLVVTTWKGNGEPLDPVVAARSAAYWLRAPNWERCEISGPDDIKLDNALWHNACLLTSGQLAASEAALGVFNLCPVR